MLNECFTRAKNTNGGQIVWIHKQGLKKQKNLERGQRDLIQLELVQLFDEARMELWTCNRYSSVLTQILERSTLLFTLWI